jgi:hypothetical protein
MEKFGDKSKSDYEKTRNVIMSCQTPEQLKVGVRMYNQLNKLHSLPESELDKLENLIGLMRIKCDIEQIDKNTSDIDKTSKKHTTSGGINELSKIKFSEDEKTPESIAKKHNVSVKDIEKEIRIGTKIEMEHTDSEKESKKIALDHISEIHDYYSDPQFGVIAIEKKQGEGRKTIRISKKDMGTLHKKGKITVDGVELTFPLKEDFNSNDIQQSFKKQMNLNHKKRFSKEELFDELRRRKQSELERREDEFKVGDEGDLEEATGADSSGSFVGAGGTISRTFKKSDSPISKSRLNKPVDKVISYDGETPIILDEEEIDEATGASSGGQYATAGFPPSKFMGTLGKKGKTPVKKTQPDNSNLGYTKVRVKEKCKTFPYCNQSPEAIETYSESRDIKTFNKSDLKLKNNNII